MAVFHDDDSDLPVKRGKCMICGENKSAAYWVGQKSIQVCSTCAIEVLPMLIADAYFGLRPTGGVDPDRIKAALHQIAERFWRALWYEAWRKQRPKSDIPPGHMEAPQPCDMAETLDALER